EFIFLTHDRADHAKEYYSDKLNEHIHLIPSDVFVDPLDIVKLSIGGFEHILPFPTTYLTDKEHRIIDVEIGGIPVGEIRRVDGTVDVFYTQEEATELVLEMYGPIVQQALKD
ncbi:MAG: hypothetical protein AAF804_16320, partial [Bacteroidota bacterium]